MRTHPTCAMHTTRGAAAAAAFTPPQRPRHEHKQDYGSGGDTLMVSNTNATAAVAADVMAAPVISQVCVDSSPQANR